MSEISPTPWRYDRIDGIVFDADEMPVADCYKKDPSQIDNGPILAAALCIADAMTAMGKEQAER